MAANAISRRRAITIFAASAAAFAARPALGDAPVDQEWRGYAFGAEARIIFSGGDRNTLRSLVTLISDEIERLELALSLFRSDSEIARLNRDKRLTGPTADMVRALYIALQVSRATDGLFDPTVQALWSMYVDWLAADPPADPPPRQLVGAALRRVDWRRIRLENGSITVGDDQPLR
jgi:thiamine biosynthesis lipoprotein